MSNQESPGGVSRRALLKSTALGSLALAAGGLTLPFTLRRAAPRRRYNRLQATQPALSGAPARLTAAAAAPCGCTCVMMLSLIHISEPTRPY